MLVYSLFFAHLVIGSFLLKDTNARKVYLFSTCVYLFLIIGLRDITIGEDTFSYVEDFRKFSAMSLSEMLKTAFQTREPLYVIISWLPSVLSTSYSFYLLTWALFPVISIYGVLKRELSESKEYLIAILVFFLLGLFAFYVAGIRQTAALSIVMPATIRLNSLFKRHSRMSDRLRAIGAFMIMVGIAYLIHNSSIIALLAIPCLFLKFRWWYVPIIIVPFFIGKLLSVGDIVLLSEFLFNDRFASYGTVYESSTNLSGFIMQLLLFLICLGVKGKLIKRDERNNFYLVMMLFGLLIQSLSPLVAEMFRISFYFSIYGMVLVPKAFQAIPGSDNKLIYYGFVLASLFYLFFLTGSNLPEYKSVFHLLN